MDRRSFLTGLGVLLGGIALEEAIPLNRVYSFPTEIVIPKPDLRGIVGKCYVITAVYPETYELTPTPGTGNAIILPKGDGRAILQGPRGRFVVGDVISISS